MLCLDEYINERFSKVERTRSDLRNYQSQIALPFLKENPFSALFVDMGLGKTAIVLTLLSDLLNEIEFEKVLIIGPLRVVNTTWPDEIPIWEQSACLTWHHIRDDFVQEVVRKAGREARAEYKKKAMAEAVDMGLDAEATKEYVDAYLKDKSVKLGIERARIRASRPAIRKACSDNPASIHLINREQVPFLVDAWGKDWPYDVVIVDESTSFKDHKTTRFKALRRVRPLIKRLHLLTGTPTAEGYMGLFAQIYLLDQGERLGRNITAYRERYFVLGYNGYTWKLRDGADSEITEKISDICLTLKKEDYLPDMPEPVFNPRFVTLTPEEMETYKQFERDFVIELDDGVEIEAETAANLSSKLLQLASGCVYDGDKNVHNFHDHKIEEMRAIVEEAGDNPLLVTYWFKSSLDRLKKAFPKGVVMDREGKAVAPWNRGEIPMLFIHPQGAGHGLNLQKGGHHLVFFDIPWSLELYQQTIRRLDRPGQNDVVILHHIIAKGTVDEFVVKSLRDKADVQEKFFQMLKQLGHSAT